MTAAPLTSTTGVADAATGSSITNIINNDNEYEYDEEEFGQSLIIPITSMNDDNDDGNGTSTGTTTTTKFIEIFPEEMKETSVMTLIKVLQDEKADKSIWVNAAVAYMQRKQPRDSLTILVTACELGDTIVPDSLVHKDSKVRLLASTGIAHLAVGELVGSSSGSTGTGTSSTGTGTGTGAFKNNNTNTKQGRQIEKEEIRNLADTKFTQANKIDTFFPMIWIGRGILNLSMIEYSKERQEQAKFFFITTLKHCGPILPALLGLGSVLFNEGDYNSALDKYSTAIKLYPTKSGASTRVGFALCCYRLGQVDRAKVAFNRALQIDPENVPAMVGSAILEMSSFDMNEIKSTTSTGNGNSKNNTKGNSSTKANSIKSYSMRTEKAIKMISMANLLDHSNAMVQNHLANHYFWKWIPVISTTPATTGTSSVAGANNNNKSGVIVQIGSNMIKSYQLLQIEAGDLIRIGNKFETIVKEDVVVVNESVPGTTITTATPTEQPNFYYLYKINTPWQGDTSADSTSTTTTSTTSSKDGVTVTTTTTSGLMIWKKDYERVIDLAKGGYSSTVVQEIQAESLFFLARVYHVREDNENAYKFYDKACTLAPTLHPARYGLIQTLIIKEQYTDAIRHLHQLISSNTNTTGSQSATSAATTTTGASISSTGTNKLPSTMTNTNTATSSSSLPSSALYATDALALLGLLQVRSGASNTAAAAGVGGTTTGNNNNNNNGGSKTQQEDGILNIRKAIELDPTNSDLVLLEAYALQLNTSDYSKALDRYKKVVTLLQSKLKRVPYNVYNNIGVLCHETKQYIESLQMYTNALHVINDNPTINTISPGTANVPLLKNIGIDGGRIRHTDNNMFYGYVDSKIKCSFLSKHDIEQQQQQQIVSGGTDNSDKNKTKILKIVVDDIYDATLPFAETDEIQIVFGFGNGNFIVKNDNNDDAEETSDRVTAIIERIEQNDNGISYLHLVEAITLPEIEIENDENQMIVDTDTANTDTDISTKVFPLFVKRENSLLDIKEVTTIAFNIARLHETTGRTLAAIELHKAIAKRNPAYVNSYLRLACIAVDCGYINECAEWLKIAAVSAPGNSEVLTLIGNLHLSLCDWKPAQTVFDGLMAKKIPSVEAYSSLSMGNIYFATLHVKEDRYTKHLQYAADFYKRILTKDPLNAYAANGIGTVLAEKAEIYKAKEVFNRVREVSGDTIADSLLNLGHIYLAQKKHPESLQMYKSYLKRAEDGTTPITSKSRLEDIVDVLLYIAFAYFDWARHTELFNDVNAAPADGRYKEAMEHIRLAISKRSKKDVILKYNLCMTKLQAANCVLQKLTRNIPRTVQEVEEALHGLEDSYKIVEKMLHDKEAGEKINIRTSVLEDFLKHCRANITSAQSHLEDEKKRAEEEFAEQEFRKLAAEAAIKETALKQAIDKQEQLKRQEEQDRRADAKMRKVDELKVGWTREQVAKEEKEKAKNAGGKKRGRGGDAASQDFIVDDDNDNDDNSVGQDNRTSSNRQGLFDDSDEDDNNASDDDDGNGAPSSSSNTKKKRIMDNLKARKGKSAAATEAASTKTIKPSKNDLFGDSDDDDVEFDSNPIAPTKASTNAVVDASVGKKKAESKKSLFGDSSDEDDDNDKKETSTTLTKETEMSKKPSGTNADLFGDSDDDNDDDDNQIISNIKKRDADEIVDNGDNDDIAAAVPASTSNKKQRVDTETDDKEQ